MCQLLANCKIAQKSNPQLRYQIRLGNHDIELWTKHLGEQYFLLTPLNEFGPLPSIGKELNVSPIRIRNSQKKSKRDRSVSPDTANKAAKLNSTSSDEETLINALDMVEKDPIVSATV